MKIVIFDNAYWNILNFRSDLVKALILNNYEIIAVAPISEKSQVDLEEMGIKCIPINYKVNGVNPLSDIFLCIHFFIFFLRSPKIDFVLTYTIKPTLYATIVAKLFGIKVINNISGLGSVFINKSIITKLVLIFYRLVFSLSDWIFFQNKHDLEFFQEIKFLKLNYSVIPGSGVNLKLFDNIKLNNPGKKFLFVGRIMGEKGIRELIFAAQELNKEFVDLKFYFVGEIGYDNFSSIPISEIENWKISNSNFYFTGKVRNIKEYYEIADIMVLPSYREGLSKSLIEASAMSLPIITTDVPGCADVVINRENGMLVKVKNSYDLLDKMRIMILMDEVDRIKMGDVGRQLALNKFNVELVINSYMKVLNDI